MFFELIAQILCQIVSGGLGFDIKVKSPNLIIKDKRYLTEDTNFGPPIITYI